MNIKVLIIFCIFIVSFAFIYWDNIYSFKRDSLYLHDIKSEIVQDFQFTNIDGKSYLLSDIKNKIIIINFWATWCPPCKEEFPDLLKLAALNQDIMFLFISIDDSQTSIDPFLKKLPLSSQKNLPLKNIMIVHDTDKIISRNVFKTFRVPETYILDDRTIAKKYIGVIDFKNTQDFLQSIQDQIRF